VSSLIVVFGVLLHKEADLDIQERSILQLCAVAFAAMLGLLVDGCTIVDSSMGLRIDAINGGYDTAINDEILTNIVRASHFQDLSDVKLGLPNITLGPSATTRQYIFAGNQTDNSASLSLELDPIETHDFHNSLLTPLTVGTIGVLLQNFPKELVYLALIDSIRFQETDENGKLIGIPIEYKNYPTPPTLKCPVDDYTGEYYPELEGTVVNGRTIKYNSYYHPPGEGSFNDLSTCKYQRFYYWVETAVAYGLTVSFSTVTNPKYVETDPKGTQPKTITSGHFCFDSAQAQPKRVRLIGKDLPNTCDQQSNPAPTALDDAHVHIFNFSRSGFKSTPAILEIKPRSLMGVFLYLGKIVTAPSHGRGLVPLYSPEASSNGDNNMLTTTEGLADNCFAVATLNKEHYCVPAKDTDNTKRVFALLSELITLSSTASDIPTSLTVRLTP
jgi:hypothetical protein